MNTSDKYDDKRAWSVQGREFTEYHKARYYAEAVAFELDRPVSVLQRDDNLSPWFLLEKAQP